MWKYMFLLVIVTHVSSSKIKVAIIGAGPAGIAAASRLLDNNISDFKILEAENRIGGRIHSFYLGDAVVDLGAEFVHGQKGNIVYQLAEEYVINGKKFDDIQLYYSGRLRSENNLLETFDRILYDDDDKEDFENIGDCFTSKFNSSVFQKTSSDLEMSVFAKDFLRLAECFYLSLEGAFSWYKTITSGNFEDCEGKQTLSWQGRGYKTILDILLKNFPNKTGYNIENQLLLNKKVLSLKLQGDSVKIGCEDGEEFLADHVIFTPSLGVLKHDHEKIFQPALNDAKKRVIKHLGFDGVMKIIFEFPNAWWNNINDFVFVWNDQDKKDLFNEIPFGPIKDGDHWLSWFYNIGKAPNNTNVLIGWFVGPMVPEVEKLTEEQMSQGTVHVMKKFLGRDYNITDPIRVIHSKWCSNPNFRGTYSFESVELKKNNIQSPHKILAEPINGADGIPRILFAGEATNTKRFSTVDGAIGSGFREGDRLIELIKH